MRQKFFATTVFAISVIVLCIVTPANAALTVRCQWGVAPMAPTVWSGRTQVMMMPIVMDFHNPASGVSDVAFISFEGVANLNSNSGGVLRVIDPKCLEIAQFPPPAPTGPIPPSCPANIYSHFFAPSSGIAAGEIDGAPDVEIIAVLDDPSTKSRQLVALNLVQNPTRLVPKWCSQQLPPGDFITASSVPSIAQLDAPHPALNRPEIIIDNKVFNFDGTLRYNGTCTACSRSRTSIVANISAPTWRPQVITGHGAYRSLPPVAPVWAGTAWWSAPAVTNSALTYSAVADLDLSGTPKLAVVDTLAGKLRILSATGVSLASASLSGPGCGGPPMIGNADGTPGPEIGVASCTKYQLFKYSGGTLTQVWSKPISDPSGQTTSTLFNTSSGARIFYADSTTLWVFNGANGAVLQQLPNSSGTGLEGPVIASSFANGGPAALFVGANNYQSSGGQVGLRIFDDPTLGPSRNYWNEYNYHVTNVGSPTGFIPILETPNWQANNTYRVQQWP